MEPYNLYHTLNNNVPSKKFPATKKKTLQAKLKTLDDTSKEAFLMLICEHARLNDDFKYIPEKENLPYKGIQNDEDIVFDFKEIPNQLCWILSKFLDVVCKN